MATRIVPYAPGLARLERRIAKLTEHITDGVARDVRRRLADHIDTGALIGSVFSVTFPRHGQVWIDTDHWHYIEYGTQPHVIRSTGPWPLRNRKTGQVFGHTVNHPGNPEYAPMRSALYTKRGPRGGSIGPSSFKGAG